MPNPKPDTKFRASFNQKFPLPSISLFTLDSIISEVVPQETTRVKTALMSSKSSYQKDLRGELKHHLYLEQKVQHKNIRVLKMCKGLGEKLEKSHRTIKKDKTKEREQSGNSKKANWNSQRSDLNELLKQVNSVSSQAQDIMIRCWNLEKRVKRSRNDIPPLIPLVTKYMEHKTEDAKPKNFREAPLKPENPIDSEPIDIEANDVANDVDPRKEIECSSQKSTQNQILQENNEIVEDTSEDFQYILEANIAKYREKIDSKHMNKLLVDEERPKDKLKTSILTDSSRCQVSDRILSLDNLKTSKSGATVLETNLNSVHKKLRINPYPLTIYNTTNHSSYSSKVKNFRVLPIIGQSNCANSQLVSNSCGNNFALDGFNLRVLLLTECSIDSTSSDSSSIDLTNDIPHDSTGQQEPGSNNTWVNQERASLKSIQKHTPLHHTHRPAQSILKKANSQMLKPNRLASQDKVGLYANKLAYNKGNAFESSSLYPVFAKGHFIAHNKPLEPVLSAINGTDSGQSAAI